VPVGLEDAEAIETRGRDADASSMGVVASSRADDCMLEPHSPELALVDPELRALARSLLELPDETPLVPAVQHSPGILDSACPRPGPLVLARRQLVSEGPMFRIALTFAILLAAFLGVLAGMGGGPSPAALSIGSPAPVVRQQAAPAVPVNQPESAIAPTIPLPALAKPVDKARSTRSSPETKTSRSRANPGATAARRFVWAQDATASAYRFELFRGRKLILRRDTEAPYLQVPASWRSSGKTFALAPGSYRWYVWPIVDGRRSVQAIVQAALDIRANS
jgi:hypothetical protein